MSNKIIAGAGFHHVALRTTSLERSLAFYKALGMSEIVRWGEGELEIVMLDIGDGGRLELFANRGIDYPAEGRWQHFAFAVEDVEAAYSLALHLGADSHTPPKIVPLDDARPYPIAIQVAFVAGPDGELLEFFKQVK
jgi:catechol 2,3-dioxygenase-like lactoylglutathione lyase family enzyme